MICCKTFCDFDQGLAQFFYIYLIAELGDNANIIRAHFSAASAFVVHVILLSDVVLTLPEVWNM